MVKRKLLDSALDTMRTFESAFRNAFLSTRVKSSRWISPQSLPFFLIICVSTRQPFLGETKVEFFLRPSQI